MVHTSNLFNRRGFLAAAGAVVALPAAAQPVAPPQTMTTTPVRSFTLNDASTAKLKAIAPQAPAFVTAYFASRGGQPTSWTYEDGCIWKSALDLYGVMQDKAFLDYVTTEMQARVLPDGALPGHHPADFTLDNINASKVLFPMYALTGEARFRQAMELPMAQLHDQPRTQSGNYWHKEVYPNQVWLDGVYMAQPVQVAYAKLANKPELFADTVRQLQVIEKVMKKPNGLYYHGWDESRKEAWADPQTGLSQCVWGRAMGWWTAALVDIYGESDGLDPAGRAEVARITRDTLTAALKFRSKRKLWYQVVDQQDREGNYEEASGSLMIAYGLLKGARLGIVGAKEKAAGLESLHACIDIFLTPDALNGTVSVAGLGGRGRYRDGTYAYYLTEKVRANDAKGVGPLFWSLSEALRG